MSLNEDSEPRQLRLWTTPTPYETIGFYFAGVGIVLTIVGVVGVLQRAHHCSDRTAAFVEQHVRTDR